MVIVVECVILCLLFSLMVYIMSRNPIATLYNYPPKIQERVKSMDEYKDQIPTTKNKIVAIMLNKINLATVLIQTPYIYVSV